VEDKVAELSQRVESGRGRRRGRLVLGDLDVVGLMIGPLIEYMGGPYRATCSNVVADPGEEKLTDQRRERGGGPASLWDSGQCS
jgi:hypothetical protein